MSYRVLLHAYLGLIPNLSISYCFSASFSESSLPFNSASLPLYNILRHLYASGPLILTI